MQDLDRGHTPRSKDVEALSVPNVVNTTLSNGLPVHILESDNEGVLRIDLIFDAGKWHEQKSLLSSITNAMLGAGTKSRNSVKIAEELDFCGAHLKLDAGKHSASVSLYTLKKHLSKTLPVFADLVKNSIFPEDELNNELSKKRQEYLLSQEKIETQSFLQFNELIFGEEHPYGKLVLENDYRKLSRELLLDYYHSFYTPTNCYAIVTGSTDRNVIDQLNDLLGADTWRAETPIDALLTFEPNDEILYYPGRDLFLARHGVKQSSIRIGNLSITETDNDFAQLKVVNTILGGYFGSRLMMNVREDKGYTYSIGSSLVPGPKGGSFVVSTEVGAAVTSAAIKEIYAEVDKLSETLVGDEELLRVKNYMLGEALRYFDGSFSSADLLRNYTTFGKDLTHYNTYLKAIKNITSEDIRALSQKYLDSASFIEVIVGKKK